MSRTILIYTRGVLAIVLVLAGSVAAIGAGACSEAMRVRSGCDPRTWSQSAGVVLPTDWKVGKPAQPPTYPAAARRTQAGEYRYLQRATKR